MLVKLIAYKNYFINIRKVVCKPCYIISEILQQRNQKLSLLSISFLLCLLLLRWIVIFLGIFWKEKKKALKSCCGHYIQVNCSFPQPNSSEFLKTWSLMNLKYKIHFIWVFIFITYIFQLVRTIHSRVWTNNSRLFGSKDFSCKIVKLNIWKWMRQR